MIIKSSEQLCKDYDSFSRLAKETNEPIYITKNGEGDLVLLNIEVYEQLTKPNTTTYQTDYHLSDTTIKEEKSMTENILGKILREMYDTAPRGMQVTNIHTFAIFYAEVIESERLNKREILKAAGLPESYQTEISKGINLASYVQVKEEQAQRIQKIQGNIKF